MNLDAAIEADAFGFAIAYTEDGRIIAEVSGPPPFRSKRKRRKRRKSTTVTIWTPPRPNAPSGHLSRSRPSYKKLHKVPRDKRRWLESLDWRPRKVRSVVDRLANVARRL